MEWPLSRLIGIAGRGRLIALAGIGIVLGSVVAGVTAAREPAQAPVAASAGGQTALHGGGKALARRLPDARQSRHVVRLGDRLFPFTATAGALAISNSAGVVLAEIGYVSYTAEPREGSERPVAFAFNGGPGSASAWLHLGAMGPWRIGLEPEPEVGTVAAAAGDGPAPKDGKPPLLDNEESWLAFADLVFIDPVGTGYSRIIAEPAMAPPEPEESRRERQRSAWQRTREHGGPGYFHSVRGDADSIARFIAGWVKANGRERAPKYLVGESYGGFRSPKIAHMLHQEYSTELAGMVLVSPVLDFESRRGLYSAQHFVNVLPSLVATAMERKGVDLSREALGEVEAYARSEYIVDLLKGPQDSDAVERMGARIAAFTGLDKDVVVRAAGRFGGYGFISEIDKQSGRRTSLYDASVTRRRTDTEPRSRFAGDPFTGDISPKLAAAMRGLYQEKLGWMPEGDYELQSYAVNYDWHWQNSPNAAQSMTELLEAMLLNGKMKLMVTHGFTDLVTPYFASELLLDQVGRLARERRVTRIVYPGGHMFYSRDSSRREFTRDALRLMEPERPAVEMRTEAP